MTGLTIAVEILLFISRKPFILSGFYRSIFNDNEDITDTKHNMSQLNKIVPKNYSTAVFPLRHAVRQLMTGKILKLICQLKTWW